MAVFKSLTFDGINSLDYGIYVTGEAVYNAPERVVEMVEIPGRNGSLAIDQGRFTNIEVSYPCGCFAETQADFAAKVSAFRNAIASRYSYKRLTDEYNADEYRLGLYKSGLEVSAVRYGTAGQFDITFDCKPQRFLLDGDAELSPTDYSDVQTVSGDIVQIENDGSLGVKSLTASLEPIQSLHGYDKPWSGGNGKNKLNNNSVTATSNGITFTKNADGTVTANGTASGTTVFRIYTANSPLPNADVILNGCPSGGQITTGYSMIIANSSGTNIGSGTSVDIGNGTTYTSEQLANANQVQIIIRNGTTVSNLVFKPMIRLSSETDATFAPYSNICPISGRTEVDTIVSPTTSASDGRTYTTSLGRTVYGGSLDVVSGVLTVDRAMVDLGTFTWGKYSGSYPNLFVATDASIKKTGGGTILGNAICSQYAICTEAQIGGSGYTDGYFAISGANSRVYVNDTRYTDATAFKTAVNGAQLVYELSTPQTYQLTAQEVELLLGQNNLWTDCGSVNVTYKADTYLWVEKKLS